VSVILICSISAVFVIVNLASNIAYLICMVCLHTNFYVPSSTGSLHMPMRLRAEAFSIDRAAVVFSFAQRYYLNKCHTFLYDFCYLTAFDCLKVCCASVGVTSQVCVCASLYCVLLTTHPLPVPRSRKDRAITLSTL
jgi:hypothetical protein